MGCFLSFCYESEPPRPFFPLCTPLFLLATPSGGRCEAAGGVFCARLPSAAFAFTANSGLPGPFPTRTRRAGKA